MGRVKKSFNEKYNSPFAVNMRELMKEYGVTQDTLAAKIGRTRQTVCQYVNGDSEPGYETLAKIADFFSVSTDYLLGISLAKTPGTTMQAGLRIPGTPMPTSPATLPALHAAWAAEPTGPVA